MTKIKKQLLLGFVLLTSYAGSMESMKRPLEEAIVSKEDLLLTDMPNEVLVNMLLEFCYGAMAQDAVCNLQSLSLTCKQFSELLKDEQLGKQLIAFILNNCSGIEKDIFKSVGSFAGNEELKTFYRCWDKGMDLVKDFPRDSFGNIGLLPTFCPSDPNFPAKILAHKRKVANLLEELKKSNDCCKILNYCRYNASPPRFCLPPLLELLFFQGCAQELLQLGANPNCRDSCGRTMLHRVLGELSRFTPLQSEKALALLLNFGADI